MNPRVEDGQGELVRDHLSKGEVHWIKKERESGRVQLIALVNSQRSFAGYYPMNSSIPDGLSIHRIEEENNKLQTLPVVIGG